MNTESYRSKTFVVTDPDARVRRDDDLMAFVTGAGGGFKTIPKGTRIQVSDVRRVATGSQNALLFGHALSADDGQPLGWTSTRNLERQFRNETLGALPPEPGAGRYGANAAWAAGNYLGQLELVAIVDAQLDIERLALKTLQPYLDLVAAAAGAGVDLTLNSGFRAYPEQKALYEGYVRGLPGFNTAAKPGFSMHQNGLAFDLSVPGGDGNPTYEWLKRHATQFGFVRTVSGEPWHWEFDPPRAQAAQARGSFKTPNVTS